jgi:hypothetical protein
MPGPDAVLEDLLTDPELEQLRSRDHPMLPRGELRDRLVLAFLMTNVG